jgi:hypothetical protein
MFSNVEMLYHFHVNFLAELRVKEDVASLILKYGTPTPRSSIYSFIVIVCSV